jgi:hypothetical protein
MGSAFFIRIADTSTKTLVWFVDAIFRLVALQRRVRLESQDQQDRAMQ